MKGFKQLHGEDLHAGKGDGANNSTGFEAIKGQQVMGTEEREIWFDREQDELLDINDSSLLYDEFPPLPDFPCMSSSSSSSSTPAPVKAIAGSSSASSASSSSSAASWAVLRSDAEEDVDRKNHHLIKHDPVDESAAALSSTASMEISQPSDHVLDGIDCIDVMENFGYMDLLDSNDLFDPSSIFHHDETPMQMEEFQQELKPQVPPHTQELLQNHDPVMTQRKSQETQAATEASDDLAIVFLEWLKSNKETVSAEDLRRVKIKKATIECAARRLGGGKEAMKQLLKLILEWVQTNHLQKRRVKESASEHHNMNNLPYHHYQDPFQNPNPNPNPDPNLNCNSLPPPEPNPCFPQPSWIAQPAYPVDPAAVGPGFAPVVGYVGDPFANGASNINGHPYHQPPAPADYHMLDSAQTWPPSQFALVSQYNSFPDNNLPPPATPQPAAFTGYGNQYPYQYIHGHNNQRLVRLGSSATKEARKKRMARQRRFATYHRNHNHQNNQQNQHQNQSGDPHARLGNDDCSPTAAQMNPAGSWVYWPSASGGVASSSSVLLAGDAPVDRSAMQGQSYQRQGASDRRQGYKPEKNLRFLLQKVLKQSDVGNLGRIVLPKKEAETHLPELEARDGISIAMEDIGTSRIWNMRYSFRFWPNNKSRMYLLENTGEFVRTNGLQEGDFIVIYSDVKCGKYLIRGVKVRQPAGTKPESKRPGKSQRNQHTSSPGVAANGNSSSTPVAQTVK